MENILKDGVAWADCWRPILIAILIPGDYPYCKRLGPLPSTQRTISCKLVKKSKRHKVCKKTKSAQISVGSKRTRIEGEKKGLFGLETFMMPYFA